MVHKHIIFTLLSLYKYCQAIHESLAIIAPVHPW